ncbi:unnamed protein product [Symbiodinium natans]|uniref:EF-hand domain-containing protein n=1 Tax=Symbiodinium natans TaxID=878477 RepID=A0A812TJ94_9DINO|nr:unnamed protein product [Symbiodinium natans]
MPELSEATQTLWLQFAFRPSPTHLVASQLHTLAMADSASDVEQGSELLVGETRRPSGRVVAGLGFLGFALLALGFLAGRMTKPEQPASLGGVIQRFAGIDKVVDSIFAEFDKNGDKTLDMDETKGLLKEVVAQQGGEERSEKEIHEAAKELDKDTSGGVHKAELKQLIQHMFKGFHS